MDRIRAIIVDIDDTLTDATHRRHHLNKTPPDFPKFFEEAIDDPCREHIKQLCANYTGEVLLLTGRHEALREQTLQWLKKHDIKYNKLFMKPNKMQFYKDVDFKKPFYLGYIKKHYDIEYAVDDRDVILNMWKRVGVTAYHEYRFRNLQY